MTRSVWRECRDCRRRYDDLGDDGRCAPCHNRGIDERETKKAAAARVVVRPAWCGLCSDPRVRQIEVPRDPAQVDRGYSDTVMARCPRCHPLAANRLRAVA